MSDQNFLAQFIEEPIYLIKEDQVATTEDAVAESPVDTSEPPKTEEKKPEPTPIQTEVPEPLVAKEPEPVYVKPLPTAGDNLKHCIVLVDSDEELLEEPLKELLYKIIGAVKRKPEDVLLTNCRNAGKDQIEALLANNNHKHILAFGTDVLTELSSVQAYEIHKPKYVAMLKADSLTEIASNVDKKKALWKALQEMFL
ncbi:hypothetical protein [Roseivirga sp. E12]|uniref:hypothetical protein n=1 Tax=Roseivirga sp. E12 TaxID=2819237 RepID=UPI001ABCA558|nr:hypothetical protein [Roseivirga sp. E12]MBO3697544.1 hypothetical protein [Roseivirga sp. E12]